MKITLIVGHRGTGKTQLLERIKTYAAPKSEPEAQPEGEAQPVSVYDLDAWIEQSEGRSLLEIFSAEGEARFRELEKESLRKLLAQITESPARSFTGEAVSPQRRVYVSLGAGFDLDASLGDLLGEIEKRKDGGSGASVEILWLRRPTDSKGRIFLHRPALLPGTPALEEYMIKYGPRQENYRRWADEVLEVSEGFDRPNPAEASFLTGELSSVGGVLTLLPENLRHREQAHRYLAKRLSWGLDFFELREDLLSAEPVGWVLEFFQKHNKLSQLLCSYRSLAVSPQIRKLFAQVVQGGGAVDWALELGAVPAEVLSLSPKFLVLSLHELKKGESLLEGARRLQSEGRALELESSVSLCLKLAPMVKSFAELREGHDWLKLKEAPGAEQAREDGQTLGAGSGPLFKVFLPRSEGGHWAWYRLLMKPKFKLNFWRESEGSSGDQPNLLDWCRYRVDLNKGFAAILGQPVLHSLTPAEQGEFFAERGMNVLRIDLSPEEWGAEPSALDFLQRLGLKAAAVTSPLKSLAFEYCVARGQLTAEALKLQAVNTLLWQEANASAHEKSFWLGHNTDLQGLQALIGRPFARDSSVAVWGGGGTLAVIRELCPQAQFYSARSGAVRELTSHSGGATSREDSTTSEGSGEFSPSFNPEVVIWAVGRSQSFSWPPSPWRPQWVVDLNYSEDSPGLEYAKSMGAKYLSGKKMFLAQAHGQREFWQQHMRQEKFL